MSHLLLSLLALSLLSGCRTFLAPGPVAAPRKAVPTQASVASVQLDSLAGQATSNNGDAVVEAPLPPAGEPGSHYSVGGPSPGLIWVGSADNYSQIPRLMNLHVFVRGDSLRYTADLDRDAEGYGLFPGWMIGFGIYTLTDPNGQPYPWSPLYGINSGSDPRPWAVIRVRGSDSPYDIYDTGGTARVTLHGRRLDVAIPMASLDGDDGIGHYWIIVYSVYLRWDGIGVLGTTHYRGVSYVLGNATAANDDAQRESR
jgi:hypothetical protein